jgi:hypothetical protein
MAVKNRIPRMTKNCGTVGNPRKIRQVKSKGDMYIMPRNPPESTRPMANSILAIGRHNM